MTTLLIPVSITPIHITAAIDALSETGISIKKVVLLASEEVDIRVSRNLLVWHIPRYYDIEVEVFFTEEYHTITTPQLFEELKSKIANAVKRYGIKVMVGNGVNTLLATAFTLSAIENNVPAYHIHISPWSAQETDLHGNFRGLMRNKELREEYISEALHPDNEMGDERTLIKVV